jgi:serine/threonine protein kinase
MRGIRCIFLIVLLVLSMIPVSAQENTDLSGDYDPIFDKAHWESVLQGDDVEAIYEAISLLGYLGDANTVNLLNSNRERILNLAITEFDNEGKQSYSRAIDISIRQIRGEDELLDNSPRTLLLDLETGQMELAKIEDLTLYGVNKADPNDEIDIPWHSTLAYPERVVGVYDDSFGSLEGTFGDMICDPNSETDIFEAPKDFEVEGATFVISVKQNYQNICLSGELNNLHSEDLNFKTANKGDYIYQYICRIRTGSQNTGIGAYPTLSKLYIPTAVVYACDCEEGRCIDKDDSIQVSTNALSSGEALQTKRLIFVNSLPEEEPFKEIDAKVIQWKNNGPGFGGSSNILGGAVAHSTPQDHNSNILGRAVAYFTTQDSNSIIGAAATGGQGGTTSPGVDIIAPPKDFQPPKNVPIEPPETVIYELDPVIIAQALEPIADPVIPQDLTDWDAVWLGKLAQAITPAEATGGNTVYKNEYHKYGTKMKLYNNQFNVGGVLYNVLPKGVAHFYHEGDIYSAGDLKTKLPVDFSEQVNKLLLGAGSFSRVIVESVTQYGNTVQEGSERKTRKLYRKNPKNFKNMMKRVGKAFAGKLVFEDEDTTLNLNDVEEEEEDEPEDQLDAPKVARITLQTDPRVFGAPVVDFKVGGNGVVGNNRPEDSNPDDGVLSDQDPWSCDMVFDSDGLLLVDTMPFSIVDEQWNTLHNGNADCTPAVGCTGIIPRGSIERGKKVACMVSQEGQDTVSNWITVPKLLFMVTEASRLLNNIGNLDDQFDFFFERTLLERGDFKIIKRNKNDCKAEFGLGAVLPFSTERCLEQLGETWEDADILVHAEPLDYPNLALKDYNNIFVTKDNHNVHLAKKMGNLFGLADEEEYLKYKAQIQENGYDNDYPTCCRDYYESDNPYLETSSSFVRGVLALECGETSGGACKNSCNNRKVQLSSRYSSECSASEACCVDPVATGNGCYPSNIDESLDGCAGMPLNKDGGVSLLGANSNKHFLGAEFRSVMGYPDHLIDSGFSEENLIYPSVDNVEWPLKAGIPGFVLGQVVLQNEDLQAIENSQLDNEMKAIMIHIVNNIYDPDELKNIISALQFPMPSLDRSAPNPFAEVSTKIPRLYIKEMFFEDSKNRINSEIQQILGESRYKVLKKALDDINTLRKNLVEGANKGFEEELIIDPGDPTWTWFGWDTDNLLYLGDYEGPVYYTTLIYDLTEIGTYLDQNRENMQRWQVDAYTRSINEINLLKKYEEFQKQEYKAMLQYFADKEDSDADAQDRAAEEAKKKKDQEFIDSYSDYAGETLARTALLGKKSLPLVGVALAATGISTAVILGKPLISLLALAAPATTMIADDDANKLIWDDSQYAYKRIDAAFGVGGYMVSGVGDLADGIATQSMWNAYRAGEHDFHPLMLSVATIGAAVPFLTIGHLKKLGIFNTVMKKVARTDEAWRKIARNLEGSDLYFRDSDGVVRVRNSDQLAAVMHEASKGGTRKPVHLADVVSVVEHKKKFAGSRGGSDVVKSRQHIDGRVEVRHTDVSVRGEDGAHLAVESTAIDHIHADKIKNFGLESYLDAQEAAYRKANAIPGRAVDNNPGYAHYLFNTRTGELEYATGGINRIVIIKANGKVEIKTTGNQVMGAGGKHKTAKIQLEKGDSVMTLSSSVIEGLGYAQGRSWDEAVNVLKRVLSENVGKSVEDIQKAISVAVKEETVSLLKKSGKSGAKARLAGLIDDESMTVMRYGADVATQASRATFLTDMFKFLRNEGLINPELLTSSTTPEQIVKAVHAKLLSRTNLPFNELNKHIDDMLTSLKACGDCVANNRGFTGVGSAKQKTLLVQRGSLKISPTQGTQIGYNVNYFLNAKDPAAAKALIEDIATKLSDAGIEKFSLTTQAHPKVYDQSGSLVVHIYFENVDEVSRILKSTAAESSSLLKQADVPFAKKLADGLYGAEVPRTDSAFGFVSTNFHEIQARAMADGMVEAYRVGATTSEGIETAVNIARKNNFINAKKPWLRAGTTEDIFKIGIRTTNARVRRSTLDLTDANFMRDGAVGKEYRQFINDEEVVAKIPTEASDISALQREIRLLRFDLSDIENVPRFKGWIENDAGDVIGYYRELIEPLEGFKSINPATKKLTLTQIEQYRKIVEAAHAKGIVHNGLDNPNSFMIDKNGQLFITDWSKAAKKDATFMTDEIFDGLKRQDLDSLRLAEKTAGIRNINPRPYAVSATEALNPGLLQTNARYQEGVLGEMLRIAEASSDANAKDVVRRIEDMILQNRKAQDGIGQLPKVGRYFHSTGLGKAGGVFGIGAKDGALNIIKKRQLDKHQATTGYGVFLSTKRESGAIYSSGSVSFVFSEKIEVIPEFGYDQFQHLGGRHRWALIGRGGPDGLDFSHLSDIGYTTQKEFEELSKELRKRGLSEDLLVRVEVLDLEREITTKALNKVNKIKQTKIGEYQPNAPRAEVDWTKIPDINQRLPTIVDNLAEGEIVVRPSGTMGVVVVEDGIKKLNFLHEPIENLNENSIASVFSGKGHITNKRLKAADLNDLKSGDKTLAEVLAKEDFDDLSPIEDRVARALLKARLEDPLLDAVDVSGNLLPKKLEDLVSEGSITWVDPAGAKTRDVALSLKGALKRGRSYQAWRDYWNRRLITQGPPSWLPDLASYTEAQHLKFYNDWVPGQHYTELETLLEFERRGLDFEGSIPKVYEHGGKGDDLWMIVERMNGVTLNSFIETASRQDIEKVILALVDFRKKLLKEGFHYVDWHTNNILIDKVGGEFRIRLIDFGQSSFSKEFYNIDGQKFTKLKSGLKEALERKERQIFTVVEDPAKVGDSSSGIAFDEALGVESPMYVARKSEPYEEPSLLSRSNLEDLVDNLLAFKGNLKANTLVTEGEVGEAFGRALKPSDKTADMVPFEAGTDGAQKVSARYTAPDGTKYIVQRMKFTDPKVLAEELAIRKLMSELGLSEFKASQSVGYHGSDGKYYLISKDTLAEESAYYWSHMSKQQKSELASFAYLFGITDLNEGNFLFDLNDAYWIDFILSFKKIPDVENVGLDQAREIYQGKALGMLQGPYVSKTSYNNLGDYLEEINKWKAKFADPSFDAKFRKILSESGYPPAKIEEALGNVKANAQNLEKNINDRLDITNDAIKLKRTKTFDNPNCASPCKWPKSDAEYGPAKLAETTTDEFYAELSVLKKWVENKVNRFGKDGARASTSVRYDRATDTLTLEDYLTGAEHLEFEKALESRFFDLPIFRKIMRSPDYIEAKTAWFKMTVGEKIDFLRAYNLDLGKNIDLEIPSALAGRTASQIDDFLKQNPHIWGLEPDKKLTILGDEFFSLSSWKDPELRELIVDSVRASPSTLKLNTEARFWTKNNLATPKSTSQSLSQMKSSFSSTNKRINVRVSSQAEAEELANMIIDGSLGASYRSTSDISERMSVIKYNDKEVVIKRDFSGGVNQNWKYDDGETTITDIPPHINLDINSGRYQGLQMHIFAE